MRREEINARQFSAWTRSRDGPRPPRSAAPGTAPRPVETLRPYLVEEALELDEALGAGDPASIRAELSDVLLHLAFQMVIGRRSRRVHAARTWPTCWRRRCAAATRTSSTSARRSRGRRSSGASGRAHARRDRADPSAAAQGLSASGARGIGGVRLAGRERPARQGARGAGGGRGAGAAVAHSTPSPGARGQEIGDLLFAVVNLARKAGVDAEPRARRANRKFRRRSRQMERLAAERGIDVESAGLEVLDGLWEEVKSGGGTEGDEGRRRCEAQP